MTLLRRIEDALRRVKDIEDGTTSVGLSTVQFSISHENGDGDFKLDAASSVQIFSLAGVLSGITGSIVAMQVDLVETFDLASGTPQLKSGPSVTLPQIWMNFGSVGEPGNGGFDMRAAPNSWIGGLGSSAGNEPNESNLPGSAPEITFSNGADANVNTATTGKVFVTIHYRPPIAVP